MKPALPALLAALSLAACSPAAQNQTEVDANATAAEIGATTRNAVSDVDAATDRALDSAANAIDATGNAVRQDDRLDRAGDALGNAADRAGAAIDRGADRAGRAADAAANEMDR